MGVAGAPLDAVVGHFPDRTPQGGRQLPTRVPQMRLAPSTRNSGLSLHLPADSLSRAESRRQRVAGMTVQPGAARVFAQRAWPGWGNLGVLFAWGAIGAFVGVRHFHWNPQP